MSVVTEEISDIKGNAFFVVCQFCYKLSITIDSLYMGFNMALQFMAINCWPELSSYCIHSTASLQARIPGHPVVKISVNKISVWQGWSKWIQWPDILLCNHRHDREIMCLVEMMGIFLNNPRTEFFAYQFLCISSYKIELRYIFVLPFTVKPSTWQKNYQNHVEKYHFEV